MHKPTDQGFALEGAVVDDFHFLQILRLKSRDICPAKQEHTARHCIERNHGEMKYRPMVHEISSIRGPIVLLFQNFFQYRFIDVVGFLIRRITSALHVLYIRSEGLSDNFMQLDIVT